MTLLRRFAAAALSGLFVSGCAATVGGLPVKNTPSDAAQCPDLSGVYQSQGVIISRQGKPTPTPDLYALLARPLAVRDLSQAPDLWDDTPPATVALSLDNGAWRIEAANAQGVAAVGRLPLLNGAPDAQPNEPPYAPELLSRANGCARDRLWIATESVRTQYESYTATSHVGVLSATPDALVLDLWSERRQIGLLPWTFVDKALTRYRFNRVAHASPVER